MCRQPLLLRHAPQIGDHRTREIERPRPGAERHLRGVGIFQRRQSVRLGEGLHERGDLRGGIVEATAQRLDLLGADERFVALHVDHAVESAPQALERFAATVRAAAVVGRSHHGTPAERGHRLGDPLVVRGYRHIVQHAGRLFVDPTDHELAAQHRQRLAREARRSVPSRYDRYEFHRLNRFKHPHTPLCRKFRTAGSAHGRRSSRFATANPSPSPFRGGRGDRIPCVQPDRPPGKRHSLRNPPHGGTSAGLRRKTEPIGRRYGNACDRPYSIRRTHLYAPQSAGTRRARPYFSEPVPNPDVSPASGARSVPSAEAAAPSVARCRRVRLPATRS